MVKKKKNVLKTKRFAYNAAVQKWYTDRLKRLVNRMTSEVNRKVIALFNKPVAQEYIKEQGIFTEDANVSSKARILLSKLRTKFTRLFGEAAKPAAEKMLLKNAKVSQNTMQRSLKDLSGGSTISGRLIPLGIKTAATAALNENIALIKSIPEKYMDQVTGTIMRGITVGGDAQFIVKELMKYEGMTEKRAENIANDQIRKSYNTINRQRMENVGIKKFEWVHSGGGQHPRKLHLKLDGQIFNLDDPPIIDEDTGERGFPGQLPNCRCTMAAVIEFEEDKEENDKD